MRRHEARLRGFLCRVTGDPALADDVAQDAFLLAYERIDDFSGEGSFASWLYRIAYRRFLDLRRSHHRRVRREAGGGHIESPPPSDGAAIDLDRALASLSEAERTVVLLCYGAGLSHAEAASVLSMPLGTVKSHANRGRAKAAAYFKGSENGDA
ncbi:MAG TPA: RNA polymerase sigma factor [Caulobacteraceae bacterium]